jgi:hypothetical protein
MYAEVLGAVDLAAIIVIAAVLLYALRYSTRRLEVKLGSLHATVDHVNRAVNNRPEGQPTIYEAVQGTSLGLAEFGQKLDQFITYQHDRNHAMMNDLTVARGFAQMASETVTTLETQVTQHLAAHQAHADQCVVQGQGATGCPKLGDTQ